MKIISIFLFIIGSLGWIALLIYDWHIAAALFCILTLNNYQQRNLNNALKN